MKILHVSAENFCSYKSLSFDFEAQGLTLIAGDTGAGKSTLMDAAAWTLYGTTSKEGSADDVKGWDAEDATESHVVVEVPGGVIWVFRARGPKNDLFWLEEGTGPEMRGKDLTDTQKRLEARMGVSAQLFLLGSYMTQFSTVDSFFIAKAKDRREVLEKIANQDFAIALGDKTSEQRKVAKKEKEAMEQQLAKAEGRLEASQREAASLEEQSAQWTATRVRDLKVLRAKHASFSEDQANRISAAELDEISWRRKTDKTTKKTAEDLDAILPADPDSTYVKQIDAIKERISALKNHTCSECGAPKAHEDIDLLAAEIEQLQEYRMENGRRKERRGKLIAELDGLKALVNPHTAAIARLKAETNPHGEQLKDYEQMKDPFGKSTDRALANVKLEKDTIDSLSGDLAKRNQLISRLSWLYDKSFELRGHMMEQAVGTIESSTNAYLEKYFDATLRIELNLEDSDKLEVTILNNGHNCPFRSLSGGERTMLKLAFALSLMRAAQDKAGVQFGQIFLDEPLNGLSDSLKVKAFALLQQLESEYGTVLTIDHSPELKAQFSNVFLVDKSSGHSQIYESKS